MAHMRPPVSLSTLGAGGTLDTRSHRRSHAERVVTLYEVVIGEVQTNRSNEVLMLLAEGQRKAGETAHVQPGRCIQPFNVAGRNQVFVWIARIDELLSGLDTRRWAVAAIVHLIVAVDFDDLGVVNILPESLVHRSNIVPKPICGDLHPIGHAVCYILHKGLRGGRIAVPYLECRNQLRIGVDSAERPDAANLHRIAHLHVALFLADKAPNLIHLQTLAGKVPHLRIHQRGATLTNLDAETHDGIAVDSGNPFDGTNAGTLC